MSTNIDGQFALKLPPDTSLVISYIGYKTKKVHVSSLLHSDNNVIVLEDSREPMLDGIVAIATLLPVKMTYMVIGLIDRNRIRRRIKRSVSKD